MTSTAIQYQQPAYDLPMPQGNGTFTVYDDGTLVGKPESSAVVEWTYLAHSQKLVVTFIGSTKDYFYDNVPAYKVFQMLASESIGAFISKAIKPHHEVWSPQDY